MTPVILLGLGFTTRRLAKRFLCRGLPVFAAVRNPDRFRDLAALGMRTGDFPPNAILIHTIPPLPPEETGTVREFIRQIAPRRIVYISSTGVYGTQTAVDETTPAIPSEEKGRRRIEEETWLNAGEWETLILRAAAIYGPRRGVHVRVREGRLPRTEPGGVTSRIHVDDLAALLEAGALSGLKGAWPVADDYPCSSSEVALWCGYVLRIAMAPPWPAGKEAFPSAGRKVGGLKIRELLEIELSYPDYQAGVLQSLAEEGAIALSDSIASTRPETSTPHTPNR